MTDRQNYSVTPDPATHAPSAGETVSSGNGIGTPDRQPCPACGTTWEACESTVPGAHIVIPCCSYCRHDMQTDPQRTAKEPQSLASVSLAALVDIEMRRRFPGYTGIADAMDIAARLAAAGVIVAQPAEWPCVNCGISLVVCGEPRCCNDCDHPAAARGVHIGCDTDLAYEAGREDGTHEATRAALRDAIRGRPVLLDLFCGPGGATVGYQRAGFDVVGVDIEPWDCYPGETHQADALAVLRDEVPGLEPWRFDAIHASPPCHAYSAVSVPTAAGHFDPADRYPDLYAPTREALVKTGRPFVMENVPGAPGRFDILLCGTSFGLTVKRHRLFEWGAWAGPFMAPFSCDHSLLDGLNPYNSRSYTKAGVRSKPEATRKYLDAMGCTWVGERDHYGRSSGYLEAIPPAYTEWIGRHLMEAIR